MSGRWYAKVLLPEPLCLSLRQSIEHFAQGTGCMALHWPVDKENRTQKEGKRGPSPPEALLAYGSSEERQAALEENQQRPGEWGFYAAATKGSRDSKDRKNGRGLQETEEHICHRETFGELQPPQVGRGGLLGDAPSDWGWNTEPQQLDCSFYPQQEVIYTEPWPQYCPTSPATTWSASPAHRDEWGMYLDPPAQQEAQQTQPPQTSAVLQSAGQAVQQQLMPVADLARNLDFLNDNDEFEYRSLLTCLPAGLIPERELEDLPQQLVLPDFEWGSDATPPRARRGHTYSSPSPKYTPATPGSAAHVAVWRPIHHGLPCQHTFIHFHDKTGSAANRSRSCPAEMREELFPVPLQRAQTLGEAPDVWLTDEPTELDLSPERPRMLPAIETPQRLGSFSLGDDQTPLRQGPPRARRGGRGRHGKGLQKGLPTSWRPTLWSEA